MVVYSIKKYFQCPWLRELHHSAAKTEGGIIDEEIIFFRSIQQLLVPLCSTKLEKRSSRHMNATKNTLLVYNHVSSSDPPT
jgi:hypothetical protein